MKETTAMLAMHAPYTLMLITGIQGALERSACGGKGAECARS